MLTAGRELEPDLRVLETKTMDRHLALMRLPQQLSAFVLSAFGVLALATVGLYGVVSYGVARRTREIGIRKALGADGPRVVRLLVAVGLKLVVFGGALGPGARRRRDPPAGRAAVRGRRARSADARQRAAGPPRRGSRSSLPADPPRQRGPSGHRPSDRLPAGDSPPTANRARSDGAAAAWAAGRSGLSGLADERRTGSLIAGVACLDQAPQKLKPRPKTASGPGGAWIKALENDLREIRAAAVDAQRIYDCMISRERERSRGDERAEHERPGGGAGLSREGRDPERAPSTVPEVGDPSHVAHDAALRDSAWSRQAMKPAAVGDRQPRSVRAGHRVPTALNPRRRDGSSAVDAFHGQSSDGDRKPAELQQLRGRSRASESQWHFAFTACRSRLGRAA